MAIEIKRAFIPFILIMLMLAVLIFVMLSLNRIILFSKMSFGRILMLHNTNDYTAGRSITQFFLLLTLPHIAKSHTILHTLLVPLYFLIDGVVPHFLIK